MFLICIFSWQEKIQSIHANEVEATNHDDTELVRAIVVESLLSGPHFGGAGAVLAISATSEVLHNPLVLCFPQ